MFAVAFSYIVDHAAAIGALVTSLGAFIASIRNGAKISAVRIEIDGRITQLLATTEKLQDSRVEASRLEGKEQGRDQEMVRSAAADAAKLP